MKIEFYFSSISTEKIVDQKITLMRHCEICFPQHYRNYFDFYRATQYHSVVLLLYLYGERGLIVVSGDVI